MGEATVADVKEALREYNISIHASRGGSDPVRPSKGEEQQHFNPRFPWGKRHEGYDVVTRSDYISIHASRGGSDLKSARLARRMTVFQSTLPVGEATILTKYAEFA